MQATAGRRLLHDLPDDISSTHPYVGWLIGAGVERSTIFACRKQALLAESREAFLHARAGSCLCED